MKTATVKYLNNIVAMLTILVLIAENSSGQVKVDTVMMAMIDELDRSMEELQYKDFEKPFYIRYGIDDVKSTNISANLGAVVNASTTPLRNKYIRVMAGDYEFNDESLDSNIQQTPSGMDTWQVPIGNDYYGIRRSLWISTDQVYKSASRIYDAHLKQLEAKNEKIDETPHRRFAKTPTVNYQSPEFKNEIDIDQLSAYARTLSNIFKLYPKLHNSTVNILNHNQVSYFINSEGSKINTRKNLTSLQVSASKISDEGTPVFKQLYHMYASPEELPSTESIEKEIDQMVKELSDLEEQPAFDESYEGPVLFMNEAVPFLFGNNIIGKFHAADIDAETSGFGVKFNDDPMDEKIGKKVAANNLNLSLLPRLKEYQGTKLLGAYDVDNEGVIPKQEIELIKNGLLKNVMTSRTLAKDFHKPTGTGFGPGVISVSYNNTSEIKDLKEKLLTIAKDEELEYALIVKKFDFGRVQSCGVFKVSVKDGSEEFLHSARLIGYNIKSLKKISGASEKRNVYNYPGGNAGMAISYIVPSAVLVEDIEIEKSFKTFNVELPLVESPQ